jgi:peptidoglycan/LPS O-acetylase OafA/YrhL
LAAGGGSAARKPVHVALAIAAICAVYWQQPIMGGLNIPSSPAIRTWPYFIFMLQGGPVMCGALAAVLLALMRQRTATARLFSRALSRPIWTQLSDLSYSAYLYHIQVQFWMWRYGAFPHGMVTSATDWSGTALEFVGLLAVTYAVAAVSRAVVERPAARLAARLLPSSRRAAATSTLKTPQAVAKCSEE